MSESCRNRLDIKYRGKKGVIHVRDERGNE